MKLPYSWLRDYTPVTAAPKDYAHRLTMTGSKVEGWENPADSIQNVVCGRLESVTAHPDSDHLQVCQVNVGDKQVQIVTGAQNVKAGDRVPVALDGALLAANIAIKTTTMRGQASEGMLCSFQELGLTHGDCPWADPEGILIFPDDFGIEPGQNICGPLGMDDIIFDFEITPNRPDCLGVIGLARESAASFGLPLTLPKPTLKDTHGNINEHLSIEIADPDLCPRYTAAMVDNIRIAPSPQWMRDRLRLAGIRPINNIVDITNYVMLEYGQPMHAFDYGCIADKKIIVRRSLKGESTVTLDGQTRNLWDNTLLIADPQKAIGIAGVMGGENSEITDQTTMIVFESANFSGPSVRAASRKIGMRTESSSRFEKGLDCEGTLPALMRALELVQLLGAGDVLEGMIDVYPAKKPSRTIRLEAQRTNAFIGAEIDKDFMTEALTNLGFTLDGDHITIPSFRDDVIGFADIAEEIARMYGYDRIPSTLMGGETTVGTLNQRQRFENILAEACLAAGYYEAKTLSFIGNQDYQRVCIPAEKRQALVITNPLGEEQSMMRTTALPALLHAVARNHNHRAPVVRLFEAATLYLPQMKDGKPDAEALPKECKVLTLASYGDGDFFTVKGAVNLILDAAGVCGYRYLPCETNPSYHPGRTATILLGDTPLGTVGQIHPTVADNFGIDVPVYMAELDVELLEQKRITDKVYTPLPRYPAVTRDLALVCEEEITVGMLEESIRKGAGSLLTDVAFFDIYRGAQVPQGKKSVAFSLSFRSPDHTMVDAETDALIDSILAALMKDTGAQLRM